MLVGGLGFGSRQERPQFGHAVIEGSDAHLPLPALLLVAPLGAIGVDGEHGPAQGLAEQRVARPTAAGQHLLLDGCRVDLRQRAGGVGDRARSAQVDRTGFQSGQGGR